MNQAPFFYVLYPKYEEEKNLLNALKVIADPSQRTEAHITIRGPYYKNKLPKSTLERYSEIIKDEILEISGVDNFFAYGQNTVFFNCAHNTKLERVWKKFTYNEFRPHITIYDGDDNDYAVKIFNILSKDFVPFEYEVNNVDYLEPKTNDSLGLYKLLNHFKYSFLIENIGYSIDPNNIVELEMSKRLELIDKLSDYMYEIFKKKTANHNGY